MRLTRAERERLRLPVGTTTTPPAKSLSDRLATLRRRLLDSDVPADVANVVGDLLDHVREQEQALDLIEAAVKSASDNRPANALHGLR